MPGETSCPSQRKSGPLGKGIWVNGRNQKRVVLSGSPLLLPLLSTQSLPETMSLYYKRKRPKSFQNSPSSNSGPGRESRLYLFSNFLALIAIQTSLLQLMVSVMVACMMGINKTRHQFWLVNSALTDKPLWLSDVSWSKCPNLPHWCQISFIHLANTSVLLAEREIHQSIDSHWPLMPSMLTGRKRCGHKN